MMKKSLVAVLGLAILGACTTSESVVSNKLISKRKYNKGVHVNMNFKKYGTTKANQDEKIIINEEVAVVNEVEKTYNYQVETVAPVTNEAIVTNEVAVSNDIVMDAPATNVVANKAVVSSINTKEVKVEAQTEKEIKAEFKAKKAEIKKQVNKADDHLIAILLCVFIFPTLGVWWHEGKKWTKRCTNNLLWTLLCGLPGLIHGLIVILGK